MENKRDKKRKRFGKYQISMLLAAFVLVLGAVCLIPVLAAPQADLHLGAPSDPVSENRISGLLWIDENADGIRDPGEESLAGFVVGLYQEDDRSEPQQRVVTDENGIYQLEDITPGNYVVGITSGFIQNQEYLLSLSGISGDNCFQIDAGYEYAYTEVLEVLEDSVIESINAGMRKPAGIMPAVGGYIVTNDTTGTTITTTTTMENAVSACLTTDPCTITATADDTDMGDMVRIPSGKTITLTSNPDAPATIISRATGTDNRNTTGRHFDIRGTLILKDIILSGLNYNYGSTYNGGLYVSGELIMHNGAVITGCYGRYGISIYSSSGTITMEGGEISNGYGMGLDANSCYGGGVYTNSGTFTMKGGKITDNNINGNGSGVCGGLTAVFTMEGGEISNNYAARYGGGVYSQGGTIIMTGGEISGNTANYFSGGGIYLPSNASLIMESGIIRDNTAPTGAGIYTMDYSYADPADTRKYANLNISSDVIFDGNISSQRYFPPSNAASFVNFNGYLLDNDNINYEGEPYYSYDRLQIRKNINIRSGTDETFLYYLEYQRSYGAAVEKGFHVTVTVPAGQLSATVTFDQLEPGVYRVSEINSNWRYELAAGSSRSQTFPIAPDRGLTGTAVFLNNKENTSWSSGKGEVINVMQQ